MAISKRRVAPPKNPVFEALLDQFVPRRGCVVAAKYGEQDFKPASEEDVRWLVEEFGKRR